MINAMVLTMKNILCASEIDPYNLFKRSAVHHICHLFKRPGCYKTISDHSRKQLQYQEISLNEAIAISGGITERSNCIHFLLQNKSIEENIQAFTLHDIFYRMISYPNSMISYPALGVIICPNPL